MYIPKAFEVTDPTVLRDFIAANSFATLVSTSEGSPFATHLPLLFDSDQPKHGTLLGHVAAANPHWRVFDGSTEALAIFHGPHSFISPSWYKTKPAVPTWNYATVHVYGRPRVIDDKDWLSSLLDRLIAKFDPDFGKGGELTAEFGAFKANRLSSIVGFELEIERIEGKLKLSQNHSAEDQASVTTILETAESPDARALAALMRANQGASARE